MLLKIKKITKATFTSYVCDLTVKDNHNLYVRHLGSQKSILAHNCLDENVRSYVSFRAPPYNLRRLAYQHGCSAYDEGEVSKGDRSRMAELPLLEIFEYASKDVIIPYQVSEFQVREAERRHYTYWKEFLVEQLGAMVLVFAGMENKGILIDKKYLMDICSSEGEVQKLLNGVLDQFKQSDNAKRVNEILVIRKRVVDTLTDYKYALRKSLSELRKYIKSIEKPKKIGLKDKNDSAKVEALELQNEKNAKIFVQLGNVITTYEPLVKRINELSKLFNEDIFQLKEYDRHLQESSVMNMLDEVEVRLAGLSEFETLIKKVKYKINSLVNFRAEPVDHVKDWVFDIAKQDTQQLLYFNILGLKPIDMRKDGGGTTNKEFQDAYEHIPEVGYLSTHNKYKKIMSTYIMGMMERLNTDPDSLLDGKLHSDYGFKDVLTGRCLRGDSKILTDEGEISIGEIVRLKLSCKVKTHNDRFMSITDWFENGVKEVFELELVSGKKVYLTQDHPVLTNRGWIEVKDLTLEDRVVTTAAEAEEVKSIKSVGSFPVYDITVEEDHSFIANGITVHNCSSRNPNLQNLSQRGSLSKLVRRQFIAGRGEIYIKNDYNAAEVRQWANISQDFKLASTFRAGMVMRKELFLEQDKEKQELLKQKIKGEGDVHRLNYSFFFGKDPKDVTDDERTSVKAVIFGVMYGKSSHTLSEDLKCSKQAAEDLLNKLFTTYKAGGDWIKETQKIGFETLIARSPIGRVRHLAASLHHSPQVKSSTERKMCNSITQGFSSDAGFCGGRILQQIVYRMFRRLGYPLHLYENNTVHDSVEAVTKFEHLPISLYLVEQAFTTLVQHKYKKIFGMGWVIESEMDSEIGCTVGTVQKMDWYKLPEVIKKEIEWSSQELGYNYTEEEKADILRKFDNNYKVMTEVRQTETRNYLEFVKENPDTVYLDSLLLDPLRVAKLRDSLMF